MPKSKREKVVSLTKTAKKTRDDKSNLIDQIRESASKWTYLWLFNVGDMRNTHLKEVRSQWRGTGRLYFGRNKVMGKALGTTAEDELLPGLHKVSSKLNGPTGLFFTNHDPKETLEWFESFVKPAFARAGNTASKTVVLPAGPVVMYEDPSSPFPHSMDPQLRKLGLHTSLVKGVPSLAVAHEVCQAGKPLTAEQAQLLKLVGVQMASFKVSLSGFYSEEKGYVAGPFDPESNVPPKAVVMKPGEEARKPKGGAAGSDDEDDEEMEDDE